MRTMIVVTGAAGFIGSCLVRRLNDDGFDGIAVVDDFSSPLKNRNLENKAFSLKVHRNDLFDWLKSRRGDVSFVFHLGARTDTMEMNKSVFDELNLNYSKRVWNACVEYGLPLVYASSAATYGTGEHGYSDDHALIEELRPLNPYGESKNEFDKWALRQDKKPASWAGMKFFNVFGPNEYHKGRMASVAYHAFRQIEETGRAKLFRSHDPAYKDGEQLRDFVYVKDVVDTLRFMMEHRETSGIFNVGSGKARTFLDLVRAVFDALGKPEAVDFIDTPEDIRDKYQYFTEADMSKLRALGGGVPSFTLEEAVADYVRGYLMSGARH